MPSPQLFAFGGKKGMMDYLNTLEAIDVGKMTWLSPGCESNPPPAREDTAWVYDKRRCQLLMYGGWANRWLGDLHFADVSAIVGPPYAVLGLTPLIGPVMGGTEITITGLRFRAGNIVVRFSAGKSEATGEQDFPPLLCSTDFKSSFPCRGVPPALSFSSTHTLRTSHRTTLRLQFPEEFLSRF